MLLSKILDEMNIENVRYFNEQEFDSLSLLVPVKGKRMLSFIDDPKYLQAIPDNLTMLLCPEDLVQELAKKAIGLCIVEKPRDLFFTLHNYLSKKEGYKRDVFKSMIDPTAKISPLAYVSEENVIIERNVVIEAHSYIYPDSTIGENSIIRAGAVIGGEGFEFKRSGQGLAAVAHVGGVLLGQNVEIQNNTCVDRAIYPWDNTEVADHCKIDNLVHVGHGCKVGKRTMIAAMVVLGGRLVIGEDCWIGIGAVIRNAITIGNRARVNMGAVVTRSVGDDESVTGNFAIPHDQFIALMKMNLKSLEEQDSKP